MAEDAVLVVSSSSGSRVSTDYDKLTSEVPPEDRTIIEPCLGIKFVIFSSTDISLY